MGTNTTATQRVSPDIADSVPVTLVVLVWRLVKLVGREVLRTCREAVWVLRALPRLVAVLVVLAVAGVVAGQVVLGFSFGVALLVLVVVLPRHTPTKTRIDEHLLILWYRRVWRAKCVAAGLVRHHRVSEVVVPQLVSVVARRGVARVTVRLVGGHTLAAVERAADELRTSLGGHALQVVPGDQPDLAVLTITHVNHLRYASTTPIPTNEVTPSAVEIGRELDGDPWYLNTQVHTLVAGATGAGKGSVMWSVLIGLAPLVHTGRVRLIGIDLKGGVELLLGKELFTTLATTETDAVAVLEREVLLMKKRLTALAGKARKNTDGPVTLLVIDEAAVLDAMMTDRSLGRRCEVALTTLLTQGRAPGWTCLAFLQDPRMSSFRYRDLFPIGIALRLRTPSETEMVLGDHLKAAAAHHISPDLPGMAYIKGEAGTTRQVRAHFATDDQIRYVAASFPAATVEPVPDLDPPLDSISESVRKPRGPRKPRTPRTKPSMNGATP